MWKSGFSFRGTTLFYPQRNVGKEKVFHRKGGSLFLSEFLTGFISTFNKTCGEKFCFSHFLVPAQESDKEGGLRGEVELPLDMRMNCCSIAAGNRLFSIRCATHRP